MGVTKDQIVARALKDADFKAELLKDPKGTLKKYYDVDIPRDIDLKVLTETNNCWYLVIPQDPDEDILDPPKGGFW